MFALNITDPPRLQVTGKEMRWPYCARSEERHGLASAITPRPGSGDLGPPPQPVNPERTPVKKVRLAWKGVCVCVRACVRVFLRVCVRVV